VFFRAKEIKPAVVQEECEGDWIIGRPFSPNDDQVKEIVRTIDLYFPADYFVYNVLHQGVIIIGFLSCQ
jgi:hypothetical protein